MEGRRAARPVRHAENPRPGVGQPPDYLAGDRRLRRRDDAAGRAGSRQRGGAMTNPPPTPGWPKARPRLTADQQRVWEDWYSYFSTASTPTGSTAYTSSTTATPCGASSRAAGRWRSAPDGAHLAFEDVDHHAEYVGVELRPTFSDEIRASTPGRGSSPATASSGWTSRTATSTACWPSTSWNTWKTFPRVGGGPARPPAGPARSRSSSPAKAVRATHSADASPSGGFSRSGTANGTPRSSPTNTSTRPGRCCATGPAVPRHAPGLLPAGRPVDRPKPRDRADPDTDPPRGTR